MEQEPNLGVAEEVRVEWGKELTVASQIADERHWYFAEDELSEEKRASGERIWRISDKKMSGSPSSKQKAACGGEGWMLGESGAERGESIWRESERSAWSASGMGETERS